MNNTTENTIVIDNASWWENHSQVLLKEDILAEDQAWIANKTTRVVNPGTAQATVEQSLGDTGILLVQRMVVQGVVAVKRSGGRIKTVTLPQDAAKLLGQDLEYITEQINKLNMPMTAKQQSDFLPSASAPSEENLQTES